MSNFQTSLLLTQNHSLLNTHTHTNTGRRASKSGGDIQGEELEENRCVERLLFLLFFDRESRRPPRVEKKGGERFLKFFKFSPVFGCLLAFIFKFFVLFKNRK